MTEYDEVFKVLQGRADEAAERAGELTDEWPNTETRERLQKVLAYTRLALENTDASLIPPPAMNELGELLTAVVNSPEQVRESFPGWMNNLMTQVARLPMSRNREFEQQAKDAAATFQRSARGRLTAVQNDFNAVRAELADIRAQAQRTGDDLDAQASARLNEMRQTIGEAETQFRERLHSYEATLETERQESLRLRAEQAEVFEDSQRVRAETADTSMAEVERSLQERVEKMLETLEDSAKRAEDLVDLVATSSTAGAFGKEANNQQREGDKWRRNAIILGLVAAAVALVAVIYAVTIQVNTSLITAKLALAVVFGGLAGYAARQSAHHRDREVRARRLELELTSFGPFTEGLNDVEKEQKARAQLIERIFVGDPVLGQESPNGDLTLTSSQITMLGQLLEEGKKLLK